MSLTNLLLCFHISIGINENKPLFCYNSLFYRNTATRYYFGKFKKEVGVGERVKQAVG